MWMEEAKDRLDKEEVKTAPIEEILEYLAFALYKQGNLKHALKYTDELYRLGKHLPQKFFANIILSSAFFSPL